MIHQLHFEQIIPAPLDEVWDFFSDAKNLSVLTPKEMNMKVISELGEGQIFEGMEIAYFVSPLFRIPMYWKTKIIKVQAKHQFIDVQQKGPFKLWHHTHTFTEVENGVLMTDDIQYQLPFAPLGDLVHKPLVRKNLLDLFEHRKKMCDSLFPKKMTI